MFVIHWLIEIEGLIDCMITPRGPTINCFLHWRLSKRIDKDWEHYISFWRERGGRFQNCFGDEREIFGFQSRRLVTLLAGRRWIMPSNIFYQNLIKKNFLTFLLINPLWAIKKSANNLNKSSAYCDDQSNS